VKVKKTISGSYCLLALAPVLLAALMVNACGAPEPAERDRFYSLSPQIQAKPTTTPPLRSTLLVNDLSARGFLGGRQIVYQTQEQPLEVQRYNLLLWEAPPGRSIAGDLAAALRAARLFEFVITPAQRSRADYVLGGEIARFEHLPTAVPPTVVVDFRLTLLHGTDRRSLFSRRYQGQEIVKGASPEAMARAFNQLTGRLIGNAVRDLQSLQPKLRGAAGRR